MLHIFSIDNDLRYDDYTNWIIVAKTLEDAIKLQILDMYGEERKYSLYEDGRLIVDGQFRVDCFNICDLGEVKEGIYK